MELNVSTFTATGGVISRHPEKASEPGDDDRGGQEMRGGSCTMRLSGNRSPPSRQLTSRR